MKPISVRFQCFGPYMQEQVIDFTRLSQHGLFLICGETGAGKTTILDAMSYALYNQSSGSSRGKGLSAMRCKLAQKTDLTLAEFTFSVNHTQYRFLRTLEFKRKNAREEHQCWELRDDVWIPLFENPKESLVTAKAQSLLGLTYDQFRQVMILPQGQFERLLVSDSEEKEKILVSLFHADRWQRLSEELYRRAKEADSLLRQERSFIDRKLQDYGCENPEQLAAKTEELTQSIAVLHQKTEAALHRTSDLRRKKEDALVLDNRFQKLSQLRKNYDQLLTKEDDYSRDASHLALSEQAQSIQPVYDRLQRARIDVSAASDELERCHTEETNAFAMLTNIHQRQETHNASLPEFLAAQKQRIQLDSKTDAYHSLEQKKELADSAEKDARLASEKLQKAETAFQKSHNFWIEKLAAQKSLLDAYLHAQQLYLQGIGGQLAQTLQEGIPCPVCGSTVHPAPAKLTAHQISEQELNAMNDAVTDAGNKVVEAAEERRKAEQHKNEETSAHAIARELFLNRKKEYELALEQRLPGIETLQQLNRQLQKLDAEIVAYETERNSIADALQQAEKNYALAQNTRQQAELRLRNCREELEAQQNRWAVSLKQSEIYTETRYLEYQITPLELNQRKSALIRYRADLENAALAWKTEHAALVGQIPPDLTLLTEQLRQEETTLQALQTTLILQTKQQKTMTDDLSSLEKRLSEYDDQRRKIDADLDFAERLRGSRGMSLQRYVLGVMLSSITAEANRLLKNVYGGRYQLFRSETIGDKRQKGGLDLEILDHANGQRRSVKTLSGGEKFLVALSLALGLSTVVQLQGGGVQLGAMFIDEGFGSLDREAVCDALDILDNIRKGSGIVGIISHVEQLQENIPAKIEVKKGKAGSQCFIKA